MALRYAQYIIELWMLVYLVSIPILLRSSSGRRSPQVLQKRDLAEMATQEACVKRVFETLAINVLLAFAFPWLNACVPKGQDAVEKLSRKGRFCSQQL